MQAPSLRHLLAVYCGGLEHLHFVSGFNGSRPRGRVTDLTLSTVLLLRHPMLVVRDHSTKSTKGPKSVLLRSASAPRKEGSFELQVTRLCNCWGGGRGGAARREKRMEK